MAKSTFLSILVLVGTLLSGSVSAQVLTPSLRVGVPLVVSEERIDRTTFEYRLRIPVSNDGFRPERGLAVTARSQSQYTVVVETSIVLGDLPARSSVNSEDTITIHHDRTVPFEPSVLNWVFATDSGILVDSGSRWRSVEAWGQSFAIQSNGSLWAWGRNNIGQLGDGTMTDRHEPVQIGTGTDWEATTASNQESIALRTDGTLWGWGKNSSGFLGRPAPSPALNPVRVGSDSDWALIAAGSTHFAAKKNDGSLWTWGINDKGQLGNGAPSSATIPMAIAPGSRWKDVSCGGGHTLAIREDGTLWGWGWNRFGQIGDGQTEDRRLPVQIGTHAGWASVSAGHHSSLALKEDGSLWTWGYNIYGENGDGTREMNVVPIQLGLEKDWAVAQIGETSVTALKQDGSLWAWGRNHVGQLGGGLEQQVQTFPIRIGSRTDWIAFGRGGFHCLAIAADKSLWAWGSDRFGRLGDGPSPGAVILGKLGVQSNLSRVEVHTGHVDVYFNSQPGRRYQVEQSDDLRNWMPVGKIVPGSGLEQMQRLVRGNLGQKEMFYRVIETHE